MADIQLFRIVSGDVKILAVRSDPWNPRIDVGRSGYAACADLNGNNAAAVIVGRWKTIDPPIPGQRKGGNLKANREDFLDNQRLQIDIRNQIAVADSGI